MAIDAGKWFRESKAVYFDNATSRRDYRVQLRGNKSIVLFGAYLFLLIGFAMMVYLNTIHTDREEIVQAQQSLKTFYQSIIWMLASIVSLIAPALTATTVVVERQRKSLDLVFSAPVSPKYYLVGKMISSFRYTWMLLILALPVTAVCVVLGGASWSDVILSYVLFSFQALIMTSIGLLLSTIAVKPVSAIIWSYAASIVYLIVTMYMGIPLVSRGFVGSSAPDQAFLSCLNPFFNQQAAATYTTIVGHQIPNWIFVGIFAVLMSKLCLLGAGIMLSPRPAKEIISLRLHVLGYLFALTFYGAALTAGSMLISFSSSSGPERDSLQATHVAGGFLFTIVAPLFVVMPMLSCFGVDSERRFWPTTIFSVRHTLDGSPSGGLPYVLAVVGSVALAIGLGVAYSHPTTDFSYLTFAMWAGYVMAFWAAFWAVGRLTSSFFVGLRAARIMQFASFLFLVLLPLPFLASLTGAGPDSTDAVIWNLYPLRPLFLSGQESTSLCIFWTIAMTAFTVLIAAFAEVRSQSRLKRLKENYETLIASA